MSRYFTDPAYTSATSRGASHTNTAGVARPAVIPVNGDTSPAENVHTGAPVSDTAPFQLKANDTGTAHQRSHENWQLIQQRGVKQLTAMSNGNGPATIQLMKLTYATGDNYKLRIHQGGGEWMALIELDPWGGAGWHLSIFPTGQESWTGNFKPEKGNYKAVYAKDWMQYNEFHITDDKGTHFFYSEECLPLEAGNRGKSAPWGNPLWASANYLVARYFSRDLQWLNNYVTGQIAAKKEEKKNQATEEQIWKAYLEAAKHDTSLTQSDGWDRFRASYQHQ